MAYRRTFHFPFLVNVGISCGCLGYMLGSKTSFLNAIDLKSYFSTANAATPPLTLPVPATDLTPKPSKDTLTTESHASQIMRFGYPGFDNLRTFEDFVLSYDRRNRIPHWVFEHLTPDRMTYDPSVDRSKCVFHEDSSMHVYFQSKNADYKV